MRGSGDAARCARTRASSRARCTPFTSSNVAQYFSVEAGNFERIARNHLERKVDVRPGAPDGRRRSASCRACLRRAAPPRGGSRLGLDRRHVLEVDVERVRRELLDRPPSDRRARSGCCRCRARRRGTRCCTAQQRDLLVDAPVLVVLDAERHPVLLDDRERGGDLLVEAFDGCSPVLRASNIS